MQFHPTSSVTQFSIPSPETKADIWIAFTATKPPIELICYRSTIVIFARLFTHKMLKWHEKIELLAVADVCEITVPDENELLECK